MARKKKRSRARARRASANPVVRGRQAFHRGDYDGAIAAWEQARRTNPSPKLDAALAEVYFRRGLTRFYRRRKHEAGLSDLDRAARLAPNDPRYAYHLGLAHHRQGDVDTALTAYHLALEADPAFSRAAELAVLARLEKGQNPTQSAAWKTLPLERQAELRPLVGLVRGHAAAVQAQPSDGGAARLWQGLTACLTEDGNAPDLLLPLAQDGDLPAPARAVAAYALGLDALRRDRQEEALAHWQAARNLGLDTPAFRGNLGPLYSRLAEQAVAEERWAEAADLADTAIGLLPDDGNLKKLTIAAHLHAGYADAQAGRWGQALEHWEAARRLGDNSRALIQNLALAYEKAERFLEAADLWRQVVRRRPRKADAPDALTPQQVALLWGHVAECYRRAGNDKEAIATLRNAIKNDPDNADLRLELVDALAAQGRWDAASNEVGRVLDRAPDNVDALVRAARIDEGDGYLARAQRIWEKILEVKPDHLEARERMTELLYRQGERARRFRDFDKALKFYRQALDYMPDQADLRLSLAQCYFHKKKPDAARQEMARAFALDPTDLGIYHSAVDLCHIVKRPKDAEWVITQAEERAGPDQPGGHLPASFFLSLASCCFRRRQTKQSDQYLKRAEKLAWDDADALVEVGVFYLDRDNIDRALSFFDRALRLAPEHGWANYHVGASYAVVGEMREANRYWRQARRTARKTGDHKLLETIEQLRRQVERPFDAPLPGPLPFGLPGLDALDELSAEEVLDLLMMFGGLDDDERW